MQKVYGLALSHAASQCRLESTSISKQNIVEQSVGHKRYEQLHHPDIHEYSSTHAKAGDARRGEIQTCDSLLV